MSNVALDIAALSTSERLDLIELLWESLDPADLPVPHEHRVVLEERLAARMADPAGGMSLDGLRERLAQRRA